MKRHAFLCALLLPACIAHAGDAGAGIDLQAAHRRLDRLQALGVGRLGQHAPRSAAEVAQAASAARLPIAPDSPGFQQYTMEQNREAARRLAASLEAAQAACGGKLVHYPQLGMSDEAFRNCTVHARHGGLNQLVVDRQGSTPLRLYVFDSDQAHKVYAVGGVVTAILPR